MIQVPLLPFIVWIAIFVRAGLIFAFFPLIGDMFIPQRVRLIAAAMIALVLTPVASISFASLPNTPGDFIMLVLTELVLAAAIGLVGRILFGIVQFSGQIAGEQMGYGIVNAIDPASSSQISVVAEAQYVLAILLFFVTDVHHSVIAVIGRSFDLIPPGGALIREGLAVFMLHMGTTLFEMSLQFAMPVIIIIFAINVSLGLIARAVPQINVFMESFPLRIIAGMALLIVMLGTLAGAWVDMFGDLSGLLGSIVKLMAP